MKTINIILCFFMLGLMMNSCKKDDTNSVSTITYPLSIRMTDTQGPYDAVYIDLEGVEINGNNGTTVFMNVNSGIYNLLDFTNGLDTLIAAGALNEATVQQIRLILGPSNSVVVNGVSHPLKTPSAQQSGLKIQVHQTLQAGVMYNILLDFDANKSIVDEGNGNYSLKPVIRAIETALSGAIKGNITPIGTPAFVTATIDTTSYATNVSSTGNFLIQGLPAGIYSVTVIPALLLNTVTIDSVVVTVGVTTDIGTINL